MLFRNLVLAAVATAFVIIPEISENDENIFRALPLGNPAGALPYGIPGSAFQQSVSVPCPGCKGRHTELRLDFEIEDETKLLLNGFQLYPDANPWSGDLHATLVHGNRHRKPSIKKLGYSLAVYPKTMAKEDSMELVEVDLRIIEVGTRFVNGIPPVKIGLIKTPGGNLAMATVAFDQPAKPSCTTIWCRAKELADKLRAQAQKVKGCGKGSPPKLDTGAGSTRPSEIDESDAEVFPNMPESNISSKEEWRHLIKSVAGHIIMPIVMGVTAGVAVAFLALCIQSMARHLSNLIRRKRNCDPRGESYKAKAPQNEPATLEEKVQLMA